MKTMTSRWRTCIGVGAVVSALALSLPLGAAQQVDVNTLGPQVGDKAIAFRLTDQNGQPQSLSSVAGPKGTMLVFFRSADW